MKKGILLVGAALLAAAAPALFSPAAAQAAAESNLSQSSLSLIVEPHLNDGRLVIRLAAKNLGQAAVPFGPSNISIAKPTGEAVKITPLSTLIDDVRLAAGMEALTPETTALHGAYASPELGQRDGRVDVTGFTGGSTLGRDEFVRRNQAKKVKPTITQAGANQQIAALNQAILKDGTLAPGQVVAGQVVSEQLKFGKKEERTLHLRIRLAGDEHSFTILAPAK